MADNSQRLAQAIGLLHQVADDVTPGEASSDLDQITLQLFWREWRDVSVWAGSLWRLLEADLSYPAVPAADSSHIDIGGSG